MIAPFRNLALAPTTFVLCLPILALAAVHRGQEPAVPPGQPSTDAQHQQTASQTSTPTSPDTGSAGSGASGTAGNPGHGNNSGGHPGGQHGRAHAASDALPAGSKQTPAAVASPPSKEIAKQLAWSLETASQTAQRMGAAVPDINTRQATLRAALQAASTQVDVDKIVAQYASAIDDVLVAIAHNGSAPGMPGHPETSGLAIPPAQSSSPGRLALFFAGIALILSLLAPLAGWFLARREITKALIEAGLI